MNQAKRLQADQNHCVILMYTSTLYEQFIIKLMKGKALRKHSLYEKTAASVLLKLFISSDE